MSSTETAHVEYTLTIVGQTVKFVGEVSFKEEMNSPYELKLSASLEVPHGEDVAKVNRALRLSDATLRMEREGMESSAVEIHGIIANTQYEFSPSDVDEDGDSNESRRMFDLEIVPAYALLEHHKNKPRAWHNRSYAEVLEEVLAEGLAAYQRRVENKAEAGEPIPLITRSPGESLLRFAQRLLYESGINIYFDFDAGAGREVLVMCDTNEGFEPAKLPYDEPISFSKSERTTFIAKTKYVSKAGSSRTTYGGFDPVQTPGININEETVVDDSLPAEASELRWTPVRHGGDGSAEGPHKVGAKRHAERAATQQFAVEIESSILSTQSGRVLPIDTGEKTVNHIVTGTSFEGGMGAYMSKSTLAPVVTPDGQNITVRAPAEKPPQTYQGVSLARVASSGAAVDVDGRLWAKIRFVWDESGGDEPETRAPVLQPMAGTFGGTQWIPRKDDVVVVAFLEGSRENPVIIGCQYDKAQSPLHLGPASTPGHMKSEAKAGAGQQLPGSDTWLGWSYSSISGGRPSSSARTMFAMNVAEGSELFYINAPRDYRVDVTRNADVWVKGESTHNVAKDHTEEIGGKYDQTVKGKRTDDIQGAYSLTVGMKSTLNLGKGAAITSDADMQLAAKALIRCQSEAFRIDASDISFSTRPSVGGGAGGAATDHAGLSLKRRADLSAPEAASLRSGQSKVEAGARKILLDGPAIELQEGGGATAKLNDGALVIDAPKGITLRCGNSEIRITADGIEIDGPKVTVKSKGDAVFEAQSLRAEADQVKVDTAKAIVNAERLDITGEGGDLG